MNRRRLDAGKDSQWQQVRIGLIGARKGNDEESAGSAGATLMSGRDSAAQAVRSRKVRAQAAPARLTLRKPRRWRHI